MHVGDDASENKECASDGEKPSDNASSVPEEYTYADQHRQKRDAERVPSVETPVGTDYADLIAKKIASDTSHGEADQEVAEAARRPTHIAEGAVFHATEDIRILDTASAVHRQLEFWIPIVEAMDYSSSINSPRPSSGMVSATLVVDESSIASALMPLRRTVRFRGDHP